MKSGIFVKTPWLQQKIRKSAARIFLFRWIGTSIGSPNRSPHQKTLMAAETLQLRGTLTGHNGWVTQIATNPKYPDIVLSASRDKSLIVWKLTRDDTQYGVPQKRLHGHGHFVSDVVLSSDGHFALSGSWDKNLRLWDLSAGKSTRRFEDHSHDVLSVAFSADNRQIVSGSRDKTIKLWNTLAQCKYTIQEEGHTEWVSCVRFSPNNQNPIIVSCGWDKYVKVSNAEITAKKQLKNRDVVLSVSQNFITCSNRLD